MSSEPVVAQDMSRDWRDHPGTVRPTVLVLGGFLTAPPIYDRFRARLAARGAAGSVVSSVWTPDWILAASRDAAAITTRAGRALLEAGRLSQDVSDGAPLLVVGHSAGGLIARLLTAPEPFPGRRFGATRRIGAIVTLGTPHVVSTSATIGRRVHGVAAAVAEAAAPGARYAPEVGYVSVSSGAVRGDPRGSGQERLSYGMYRSLLGRDATPGIPGDGLVPVRCTLLAGARSVVLDGIHHGPGWNAPWYGTDVAMDVWWPIALESWRAALAIRAGHRGRLGSADRRDPSGRTLAESLEEAG